MFAQAQQIDADPAQTLAGAHPVEILRWASDQYKDKLTFSTGFGIEGCVIIDMAAQAGLSIDIFTLDTGVLFPDTYDLWQALERRYAITIRGVKPSGTGPELNDRTAPWERDPDSCCQARKVRPLAAELAKFDAWITSIRRDQTAARSKASEVSYEPRFQITKVNPLVGWSAKDVWHYARKHDVPINGLYEKGFASIGCAPCTTAVVAGEDERAGRWRGRKKTECGIHAVNTTLPVLQP